MTDAGRQRRRRERSSHIRGTSQNLLDQLNRAYAEGEARAIGAGLNRLTALNEQINDPEFEAAWQPWQTALERISLASMSAEQWIQQARELGGKLGEDLVRIAERECFAVHEQKLPRQKAPITPEPDRRVRKR